MESDLEEFRVDPSNFVKNTSKKDISSGYGLVSFYFQKNSKINCVCKKTNQDLSNETVKRSFTREVEILAHCQHPTIVPFIGFAEINGFGQIYLVEAKNGSLQDFLDTNRTKGRDPNFNDTTKYIISYGVARCMAFLHNQDRIHRDLKPGNILLDEQFYPLVTDFGTSKQIDNSIKINQTLSQTTAKIMAPEFIENPESFSNKLPIDVFSYGVTLYELWTEIPFLNHLNTPFLIMNSIVSGQRPEIPKSTPEKWSQLIKKCWSNNSHNRPTFQEIVDDLENDDYLTNEMNNDLIHDYKVFLTRPSQKVVHRKSESDKKKPMKQIENPVLTKMRADAQNGDPTAQFNYVVAQFEGTYGEPNFAEAQKYAILYCQRPCAFDNENIVNTSIMQFYAGKCYAHFKKYDMAYIFLRNGAMHGNSHAAFFLAELMNKGKINHTNNEKEMFYSVAAKGGIPEAVKKYAYMNYYGTLKSGPNKKKAISLFKQGSDQGDPEMMYLWAIRNEFGRDIDKDVDAAMDLMKLAADKGYTPAMVDYGIHLLNGINIPKSEKEAKAIFQAAASKNDPWGQLWFYLMCKNENSDDDDDNEDLENIFDSCLNSYENPEAWAVYGRKIVEQGKIDDALPSIFYACQFGSINAFLCLAQICEKNKKYGDSHFYFKLASNYCHCLDVCGFSTPIKYKVFRCEECNLNMCEGCAKHCHLGHKIKEIGVEYGFKCECGKNGFQNKCNSEFVGETECYQHLYQCSTCCIKTDNLYICKSCAENCHKGHQIIDCGVLRNFCSCGMKQLPYNFNCQLLKFNKIEECSETKQKQRWFQCLACKLCGSEEKGVCQPCSVNCHENHEVIDLGVKDQCCCCKNEKCLFQEE